MSRLAVIGDVHAHLESLLRVLDRIDEAGADGVLLVGDIGSHVLGRKRRQTAQRLADYERSLDQVFGQIESLDLPWAFVPGNHDLERIDHPNNADGRVLTVADFRVSGIGGAGPHRFGFHYEWTEEEIRARDIPDCDVLLVHCPPKNTLIDWVPKRGLHVGSVAIRERAEAHTGFMACGHIHESPGAVQLGDCLCLNAGGLGNPHGRPQLGWLIRDAVGDRVVHEDLDTEVQRSWRREQRISA